LQFESGTIDANKEMLQNVMAISSGNSLFIAKHLLCDPLQNPAFHQML
jgi:hypothetical protein